MLPAEGIEGYFEYNLNAWDVAAGVLIVKQAGGTVTDYREATIACLGENFVPQTS
jgi:myo-inositol-1(or 4)-monophosphatase